MRAAAVPRTERLMRPSRIFVEEAYILKNAAKLADIPVHIVQVNKFPIMGNIKRGAAW